PSGEEFNDKIRRLAKYVRPPRMTAPIKGGDGPRQAVAEPEETVLCDGLRHDGFSSRPHHATACTLSHPTNALRNFFNCSLVSRRTRSSVAALLLRMAWRNR